ncbi:protein FAN-like isoform X2 [Mytilus trossulus]|uniref:protein FAN-like isoform X2 n=1 Tax=Mytilus trossulus TaxID=6551 RepID=UPI003006E1C1
MSFLENDTASKERFNLLLLDPGEIYFEDYSVFYYPCGLPEQEAIKRKQRGHLKICSKSMVFVPKESQYPILKFPLRYVTEVDEWSGGLFSKIDHKDKMIKVACTQTVAMKENNILSPYVFIKEPAEHIFSLNYVVVDDCLPQICQLHRASTLPPSEQNAMINAIVLSRRSRVKFNTSWLEDLYENIVLETQGDRITPLVTNPGRIMLTNKILYFQPFNNIESIPVIKIRLKDINRLIKRRFLLRQIGIEIFCKDGSSCTHLYLSLSSPELRNDLFFKMKEQSDLDLESPGQEDMTLRWQSGNISNYHYLMYLNSLADRSFSDLTQYPVMPWILSDYSSSHLDLNDPSVFRDLSKPIGALNEDRIEKTRERYREMPEPKFLYGSHYSTPGYVLFYLARIAPEYVLCLQNGKFDQPDRMFNSLLDTWQNCLEGAADFKELIPEFYSPDHPDFLYNKGITNFGIRQDGKPIGDVDLPPWAISPEDFKESLRMALESDYVSSHLHHWIDLIFGYKQRGEEAEKADNVFYYMTYEGAVDLDSISDPNERARMEIQIMEFGQTPKQLFKTQHPQKFQHPSPQSTVQFTQEVKEGNSPTPENSDDMLSTDTDEDQTHSTTTVFDVQELNNLELFHQYTLHKDSVTDLCLARDGRNIFSVSQDSFLKMYSLEEQRQLRSVNVSSMALSSCQLLPDNLTIVVGSWDNNVYFYSIEFGRILETLIAHDDAVSDVFWINNILFTSSWDSTVKMWSFTPPSPSNPFVPAQFVGQLDHESGVNCQCVDSNCQILVTGSKEGQIVIWDIRSMYQLTEHNLHSSKVNAVTLSQDNKRILSSGEDCYLKVLDIETGTEIFVKDLQDQIMCFMWCGDLLLTGSYSGDLQVWDMDRGQVVVKKSLHSDAITCIDIGNNTIVTGGQDKVISLWKP